MSTHVWNQLERLSIRRNDWQSVGEGNYYEHERRTRVLVKRKIVKGYAEILPDLSIKEHKNKKYGVYGRKLFEVIAVLPESKERYNETVRRYKYKRRYTA